jgi:hypothetical protein
VKHNLSSILAFVSILNSQAAPPAPKQVQTGRDFYNELKATNAETNVPNHYGDEYVCFEDSRRDGHNTTNDGRARTRFFIAMDK